MVRYYEKCKETTVLGQQIANGKGTSQDIGWFGNLVGYVRRRKNYLRAKGEDILQLKPGDKHFWFRRKLRGKLFTIICNRIAKRYPFSRSPLSESVYFNIDRHQRLRFSQHWGGNKGILVKDGIVSIYQDVPLDIRAEVQRIAGALDTETYFLQKNGEEDGATQWLESLSKWAL